MTEPPAPPLALLADIHALSRVGRALMGSGKGEQAVKLIAKALADARDDPAMVHAARAVLSFGVPGWHAGMLAENARNHAFSQAIARAAPGRIVLDIGTGSGLLAMMAARAGAAHVYACEAHPALAATAREIVAANELSDRVTILPGLSTALHRDRDLGGGADLIVAEIFSDDLIGEYALTTFHHAANNLTRPGFTLIPGQAAVMTALVHFPPGDRTVGNVAGFDLSIFQRHAPPERKLAIDHSQLTLASDPAALFEITLGAAPAAQQLAATLTATGPANGVVRWIRLTLNADTIYENRPGEGGRSHWSAIFQPLSHVAEVAAGDRVTVHAAHDCERALLWTVSA